MIMHHYTEPKCRKEEQQENEINMSATFFPLCRKGIHYGEIMIYVSGWRDVRLSKGWRYEPIMINAPPVHRPTAPQCTPMWPEVKPFSSTLLYIPQCFGSQFAPPTHTQSCGLLSTLVFSCQIQTHFLLLLLLLSLPCNPSVWRPALLLMMDSNDPVL